MGDLHQLPVHVTEEVSELLQLPEGMAEMSIFDPREWVFEERFSSGKHSNVWRIRPVGRTSPVLLLKVYAHPQRHLAPDHLSQEALISITRLRGCARREKKLVIDLQEVLPIPRLWFSSIRTTMQMLAFTYWPHGTVADCLQARGRYTPCQVVDEVLRPLLRFLMLLHDEYQILHRDIKPENLLYRSAPGTVGAEVSLIDFGLALSLRESPPRSPVGTAQYMPPELHLRDPRFRLEDVRFGVDIWAVGVLTWELLGGALPWDEQPSLPLPWDRFPGEGSALDFVRTCCALYPRDRPSARALLLHPFVRLQPDPESSNSP